MTDKTFVRITNKMIYDEIQLLKTHVQATNGKVKMNRLRSTVAMCLALTAVSIVTGIKLGMFGVI